MSAQEREQHAARVGLPDEGAGLQHTHDRKRGHREEAFVSGVSAPSRRDASALDVLSALTFHHQPPPPEPAEIPTPQLSCVSKASPPHRASPPPGLPQPASPQSLSVSVRPSSMSQSDVSVQHSPAVTWEGTGMAAAHMRALPRGEQRGVGAGSSGGTDVYIQRASVQASIAAASQAAIRASAPSPRSQTGQNILTPAMTAGHDLSALGWAAAAGKEGFNNPHVSRLMSEARDRFARFQVCVRVCARSRTQASTHAPTLVQHLHDRHGVRTPSMPSPSAASVSPGIESRGGVVDQGAARAASSPGVVESAHAGTGQAMVTSAAGERAFMIQMLDDTLSSIQVRLV